MFASGYDGRASALRYVSIAAAYSAPSLTFFINTLSSADLVWHQSILATKDYLKMCNVLSKVIHHDFEGETDRQEVEDVRMSSTRSAYEIVFGRKPHTANFGTKIRQKGGTRRGLQRRLRCRSKDQSENISKKLMIRLRLEQSITPGKRRLPHQKDDEDRESLSHLCPA